MENKYISEKFPFSPVEFSKILEMEGFSDWCVDEKSIRVSKNGETAEIEVDFKLIKDWCLDDLWLRNNDTCEWYLRYAIDTLNQLILKN